MNTDTTKNAIPSFIEIINPAGGSTEETLRIMKQLITEAGFEFEIFSTVERLPNGKNQYGLNGAIAAAVKFFFQLNYFKKEYNLKQIFKAYSAYTGNNIAKLESFLSEFWQDKSFIKHKEKLKALKINKLA